MASIVADAPTLQEDVVTRWAYRIQESKSWMAWLDARGPKGACKCEGFGPMPKMTAGRGGGDDILPLWHYMVHMDLFMSMAGSVTYISGLREFMNNGVLAYVIAHLTDAVYDCAVGAATLLLYGLELIEEHIGIGEARRCLAALLGVAVFARKAPCHLGFTILDSGFAGNPYSPNFGRLPFLLGMDDSVLRCDVNAPRIFVYDMDERWLPKPTLPCAKGLAATELWVHRLILQSDCRVSRAEEADFLYVPLYARCLDAQHHRTLERGYSWEHPFANATSWYAELLKGLAYFADRPEDHIFLFPEEHWPVPESFVTRGGIMHRSVILSPEARPLQCSMDFLHETGHACMHSERRSSGSLIMIPSYVDSWRADMLRRANLPLRQRTWLACFMGLGVEKGYSLTKNYRDLLRPLQGIPDLWIGGYVANYVDIMGASVFCLVPKGVGTWSHRLYEATLAGCIPVLLSDDVELPFPDLPWQNFSVKFPMKWVSNSTLPVYLRGLAGDITEGSEVAEKKRSLDEHSCWFDYHSERQDCSPLKGLTRQLRMVQDGIPAPTLDGFWMPGATLGWKHT
eukprot:TRINITY_DN73524_c0_g1_i1.p1 TRINITY_DN73524_c0_g1~~TRINITY_DN73524_c0_g1_i1.p1  ORF type:complete len:569 (+),score=51.18 TRINITY_DN73524_c0_g1_i1:37-1743(+)